MSRCLLLMGAHDAATHRCAAGCCRDASSATCCAPTLLLAPVLVADGEHAATHRCAAGCCRDALSAACCAPTLLLAPVLVADGEHAATHRCAAGCCRDALSAACCALTLLLAPVLVADGEHAATHRCAAGCCRDASSAACRAPPACTLHTRGAARCPDLFSQLSTLRATAAPLAPTLYVSGRVRAGAHHQHHHLSPSTAAQGTRARAVHAPPVCAPDP